MKLSEYLERRKHAKTSVGAVNAAEAAAGNGPNRHVVHAPASDATGGSRHLLGPISKETQRGLPGGVGEPWGS